MDDNTITLVLIYNTVVANMLRGALAELLAVARACY
jgi:hypothetical protein